MSVTYQKVGKEYVVKVDGHIVAVVWSVRDALAIVIGRENK